jgi:hypothetical protein
VNTGGYYGFSNEALEVHPLLECMVGLRQGFQKQNSTGFSKLTKTDKQKKSTKNCFATVPRFGFY